ncbi:low molecular weight protein-tyrosine-phosphatase [Chitinimonas sp. PSY-7]|uniref:arsenate reductase/protein-tyrosine-phosphatase family protein n=1 Tax=Chitinimonas sp. PSY-7 TaxID=3459088 RepID=UPI00403FF335
MIDQKAHSVLFVCMGNICRSPTAEGVFRERAAIAGLQVDIDSAGTHAYHVGDSPDKRSQKHALRRGYDLSRIRGRQVDGADFCRFDLILAMDSENLSALLRNCPPQYQHKLKLFLSYGQLDPNGEVPDPYYGGDAGFERVLDLIEDAADGLVAALRTH